ncbi:hypothetical protein AK812_SmicGene9006 [Symbiodinium microadriaticum]|uniref:Uncharacterized protein n=1 Tax=Symbiodinium microadriaticum TaxID=2951 RepID=A0A1Q9EJI6_SYMMI|nr:hypothetical protein AK812_SmicGene9006 [Symbiodinium microadriaticum]
MEDGSGDGNPKKRGQFTSLANPSGGGHLGFTKTVVDVVSRGVVQADNRCNELLGSLESAKSLDQSLAINSVEGLFDVKAKYSSTDTKLILCAGFNPCAQCETARGRLSDDLVIFAHPGLLKEGRNKAFVAFLAARQQVMVHDSEIGLESKVPDVQPPSAYRRFGDVHAFCLGVRRVESSDDKVYLARTDLLVGGLVELGGFWRTTPRVERGEPVAFEKCVQGIRIKSIRSGMKGGVTCRPAYVRHSRFDFSLEVACNDQSGTKWDTGNSTTQLAKKGVAFVSQDSRVDCEVVWKLVAIKDLYPTLGSLQLRTKYTALLYFLMANGVRLMTRMEQGEDTICTSFGAGVYGTPTVDGEFRGCGPMGFLKTDNVVWGR